MIRTSGQIFMPEKSTENNGKPQIRYYDTEKFANLALDEKTGASISLSIDTNTYIMTVALKNADGTVISSGQIDFPIESVVVNATYKDGVLTLVLQNGNSVNVDISDIISGLVAEDGDGSNLTASFTESAMRTNIATGEKLSVLFGKIKKWFTDLKSLAFKSKTEAGDYTAGSITSADTDSTIAKSADLKAENLLINPDFSINQRGASSYNTQRQYTCDRWELYSAAGTTYNANTKTFTVASGGYFWYEQYSEIDAVLLRGKSLTFTLSASGSTRRKISFGYKVDSTKTEIAGKDTTEASTKISVTGTVPNDATGIIYVRIQGFGTTGTITLEWAKLEVGSTATAFNPPLIAEELPKCQRYGFMLASGPVRYPNTQILDSTIDFTIPTPSSLRTPPTLSSTANIVVYNPDSSMAAQSGFKFEIVHTTSNAICIRASKSAHGLSRAVLGFTANVFLDAEL